MKKNLTELVFILGRSGSMQGLEGDTTDSMENASRRYSVDRIKEMIQRQKEEYDWGFLFLGANIDAVGQALAAVRRSAPLDEHWKDTMKRTSASGRRRGGNTLLSKQMRGGGHTSVPHSRLG